MTDFQRLIIGWYRLNKRQLPWRDTVDPYFIWLSEIILQQTRVAQGLEYYLKFTNNYPTVFDLASASETDVLNDWQGLGYYSRARNLHATAKIIAFDLKGKFPDSFDQIKSLKGIGDYTASAISSFAFDLPYSVVDGNVYRVLSRFLDIDLPIDSSMGKKYFAKIAQEFLPIKDSAIYNQSIMEFGALQCVPVNPKCEICVLTNLCLARLNKTIELRPVKTKKGKVRNRFFHFMIFKENDQVILVKRIQKDIWQHLFHFPLIETDVETGIDEMCSFFEAEFGLKPYDFSAHVTHILSHQKINAVFYFFDTLPLNLSNDFIVIKISEIQDFPLPRLIDRFLENNEI